MTALEPKLHLSRSTSCSQCAGEVCRSRQDHISLRLYPSNAFADSTSPCFSQGAIGLLSLRELTISVRTVIASSHVPGHTGTHAPCTQLSLDATIHNIYDNHQLPLTIHASTTPSPTPQDSLTPPHHQSPPLPPSPFQPQYHPHHPPPQKYPSEPDTTG